MDDVRLRPRFRVHAECSPQQLLSAIDDALRRAGDDEGGIDGTVFSTSAVLKIPAGRQHYWSPELQVGVDGDGGSATIVTGLFGPRPAVWTMFVAIYAFVAFVALMASAYGTAQVLMHQPGYAFWIVPIALVTGLAIYAAGRTGRSLGQEQMAELRSFLDGVLSTMGVKPVP
jgi:hypothetical protein